MTTTGEEALSIVAPVIDAVPLGYTSFEALTDHADPANSYTGSSWFGIAPPGLLGEAAAVLEPAPAGAE